MRIKEFFSGNYSHDFWKKLSLILIVEFLGVLMIAWALRPVWVDSDWTYLPFNGYISGLGGGRLEGNVGAWVFMIGFIVFAILGTSWNAYLYQEYREISKFYAIFLSMVLEISLIAVAFVGIFDGNWPTPNISGELHSRGSDVAFLGNTLAAVLGWIAIAYAYWKTSPENRREMAHPGKLLIMIVWLVIAILIFTEFGGPFWQWILMLSLMNYIFWMNCFFPKTLNPNQKE
ncbi:MAG: hypothetical protein ACFFAN_09995 [Promethearchaeota archaeon]